MSNDRSDRIPFDAAEARCYPTHKVCAIRSRCARALAAHPPGAPSGDFTLTDMDGGGTARCRGYVDVQGIRIAAQSKAKRVHPAI